MSSPLSCPQLPEWTAEVVLSCPSGQLRVSRAAKSPPSCPSGRLRVSEAGTAAPSTLCCPQRPVWTAEGSDAGATAPSTLGGLQRQVSREVGDAD
eukprot:12730494-Alexandrium_andersonii.AAC.1